MAIFGFWPKNGAKIGVIEKDLHFASELHALSGQLFGMSKLPVKCIFDIFLTNTGWALCTYARK